MERCGGVEGTNTEACLVVKSEIDGEGLMFVVIFDENVVVVVVIDFVVRLEMIQLSPKRMSSIAISP